MRYKQANIRDQLLSSIEDCYGAGRMEGLAAGVADIAPLERDFGPAEEQLAMGHFLLDGAYVEVRCDRADFASEAHFLAWIQGLYQGVSDANARVGFATGIDLNNGRGLQHHIFVHRVQTSRGEIVN